MTGVFFRLIFSTQEGHADRLWQKKKAGEATRTPDIFLGKEVLYQLSYTRV
jgi:hypothetical protein